MDKVKIGVVAPAARLNPETAERVTALVATAFQGRAEIVFHPQCFLSAGHFAGDDAARAGAFLEFANDPGFAHVWFARGGYGSGRILARVLGGLTAAAKTKSYLGYSDAGFLLAALYRSGFSVAHSPFPHEIRRDGGEAAVMRALAWMVDGSREALEPSIDGAHPVAAFNLTILSKLIGTPLMPDLTGHVLMLEEVSEHLYAVDRLMFHVTSNDGIRKVAGIRLGRVSDVPPNDPPFGQTPEEIVRHWCDVSGIPFFGTADIGHDVDKQDRAVRALIHPDEFERDPFGEVARDAARRGADHHDLADRRAGARAERCPGQGDVAHLEAHDLAVRPREAARRGAARTRASARTCVSSRSAPARCSMIFSAVRSRLASEQSKRMPASSAAQWTILPEKRSKPGR